MASAAAKKARKLEGYLRKYPSVAVAFSGGVDSSALAKAAHNALDKKAVAVTLKTPLVDPAETKYSKEIAREIGIRQYIIPFNPLSDKKVISNPKDRCYYCKKEMSKKIKEFAKRKKINVVVEGTNFEDLKGNRSGYRAVRETGLQSPLTELGLRKKDVREIAGYYKLSNSEKPANPCLATRIPYGTKMTKKVLGRIVKSERIISSYNIKQVRVRCFGDTAIIEVLPNEFEKITKNAARICAKLKELGFKKITLDLAGYRCGSMDK